MRIHPLGVLAAVVLVAGASQCHAEPQHSTQVANALDILKTVCVTGGSSLDIDVSADGGLMLKSAVAGVKGDVSISKRELEGFVDTASSNAAHQASEMRECMKPYIEKIIEATLTGAVTTGPKTVSVVTEGAPFAVADFDQLIGAAAARGTDRWHIKDIKEATPMAPAKVDHYIQVAVKNQMATYDQVRGYLNLTYKGVSYAISRDLVK